MLSLEGFLAPARKMGRGAELRVGRGLTMACMAAADRVGVRPPASIGATKIEVELE